MKYAWIHEHRGSYAIAIMCHVLEVSTSGYYESVGRPPSARAVRRERIRDSVRQVHAESHGIYGTRSHDRPRRRGTAGVRCGPDHACCRLTITSPAAVPW